jgi:hypothetical protein
MPLFRRRAQPVQTAPPSSPPPNLDAARPVITNLVVGYATDEQVRRAILEFVEASGTPPVDQRLRLMRDDPGINHRPWTWLVAVAEQALAVDDLTTVCLAAWWSIRWNGMLAPQLKLGDFMELGLDPAPAELQARLRQLGAQAAQQLPPEHVMARNADDVLTVDMLLRVL